MNERPGSVGSFGSPDIALPEAEPRSSTDRFGWWLALICATAFILRLVMVYQGRHDSLSGDGFQYSAQGNLDAGGYWFVNIYNPAKPPTALHPPAWTLALTVWAWLGQHSWFSQQILAASIGSLTVGAVGLAGRRVGGIRVGLLAAAIAAIYPGFWVYERALLSETLLLFGIAVMILLVYRFWARPSAGCAAVLGIMCGLLALIRSEQILVFVFVVAPLILAVKHTEQRRRIGWLALASVCLLVVLTPWTVYNLGRFQRPVLLSTNSGSAVLQGSCNITYYGPYTGYFSLGCLTFPEPGDESVRPSEEFHHGLTYMEHHVGRLPVVLLAREGRTFGFWNPFQQVQLDAQWEGKGPLLFGASYVPTAIWVNRLALFGFWLLLLPAAAGVIVLRRRSIPVYPLLGFFGIVALTVAATYGEPRYRAAVEVPLVLLAAVGVSAALAYRRPVPSLGDQGVVRPESSFAPTSIGRDGSADQDRLRRLAERVPVRTLAVVALAISLAAMITELYMANEVAPVQNKPPPSVASVRIVRPSNGVTLVGTRLLDAFAPRHTTKVMFVVSGGTLHDALIATGKANSFGWLARWNTTKVPDGTYALQAVAYDGANEGAPSAEVSVKVANKRRRV